MRAGKDFNNHFYIKTLVSIFAIALLTSRCANPVAPTGGPRDEMPPRVVMESPPNYSLNFEGNRIRVIFDEYIVFDNPQKSLLVSPPLVNPPDIRILGKGFEIKLNDSLKANTTYTFFFNNAVADLTERNKIATYSYVLSTGDHIDMFGLSGKVTDAYTGKPEESMAVMLYREPGDSLPYIERPWYVTKTNNKGEYEFHNIGSGPYKVFALTDGNANYRYDMPNEKVGFADSLIEPYFLEKRIDSVSGKTVFYAPDAFSLNLRSFDEAPATFKILQAKMTEIGLIDVVMNKEGGFPGVRAINLSEGHEWMRPEMSQKGDSLKLWLYSPYPDTLVLQVSVDSMPLDTFNIFPKRPILRSTRSSTVSQKATLSLKPPTLPSGKHAHLQPFIITCSYPILSAITDSFLLIENKDTLRPAIAFTDIDLKRHLLIDHSWKEGSSYQLIIAAEAMQSINGLLNDSLSFSFSTYLSTDLGNLKLSVNGNDAGGQWFVDLLTVKGEIIRRLEAEGGNPMTCRFNQLLPGDYHLRLIQDANGNGFWDSGSVIPAIQPERVIYNLQPVNIKANWDLDLEWKIE